MSKSFFIKTYGCQMNVRDSEAVSSLLARHGLKRARSEAQADIILVNTCSVRGKAEDKAIGKLGILAARRDEHPGLLLGAMGCMAQRLGEELFKRVPGVDFAVGTRRHGSIPGLLDRLANGERHVLDVETSVDNLDGLEGHEEGGLSAFVNVLFGCERRCAYCIVPDTRGREWSRPASSILEEVRSLAVAGVREVTLLGQSVMRYGVRNNAWEGAPPSPRGYLEPMSRLLEAVDAVEGIDRVHFTSGHPSGCTAELAQAMGELKSICPHMHLPMQSGSNRILKLMRRGYDADGYRAAVATLREQVPNLVVTTDIIVGFPSETDAEFEETRAMMEEIGFANAFVFKYSPRPGTPAERMEDDVSDAEKMRRNQQLLSDQDARGVAVLESFVGKTVELLVEGPSKRNAARFAGRTPHFIICVFEPTPAVKAGDLVTVRVERARAQTLYGQLVAPGEE
jgi:tRNA-2-methylthio-N6-dimethylallyladenosine synthase